MPKKQKETLESAAKQGHPDQMPVVPMAQPDEC
jgi:hypothetical protein